MPLPALNLFHILISEWQGPYWRDLTLHLRKRYPLVMKDRRHSFLDVNLQSDLLVLSPLYRNKLPVGV